MSSRDLANLKNGLVAAWIPSLGSTGYRLVDRVGSNHGTILNATSSVWSTSRLGYVVLNTDGSDDYVEMPSKLFSGRSVVSTMMWLDAPSSAAGGVIAEYTSSTSRFGVAISADGNFYTVHLNPTIQNFGYSSYASENFNRPLCVLSVFDATQGTAADRLKHYINGTSRSITYSGAGQFGTSAIPTHTTNTLISLDRPPPSYYVAKYMSLAIWGRALSATEAWQLYSAGPSGLFPVPAPSSSRTSSHFAKRYAYKTPKDKTYAAITRSQSDYDSLREGLVLAICPSITQGSGYRAPDLSGRGNHGTVTNADLSTFWKADGGVSANFDGSDDYISIPHSRNLSFSSAQHTVSAWVYYTNSTKYRPIVAKRSGATVDYNYHINTDAETGVGVPARRQGSFNGTTLVSSTNEVPLNSWNHVAYVYDGTTVFFYLNGVANGSGVQTRQAANTQNVTIGSDNGDPLYFIGNIDDTRIYNRALTPPEIRQLASKRGIGLRSTPRQTNYLETREKTYSVIVKSQQEHSSLSEGLVGAWCPSLGATGFRLIDRSGYGNHGTLTNMTNEDWVVSGGAGALDFDGSDDSVTMRSLRAVNEFSWSAFVYPRSNASGTAQGIFGSGGNDQDQAIWIANSYAGYTGFGFVSYTSAGVNVATQQSLPTLNQWYHLCAVRDLKSNTAKLYVNGIEGASVSLSNSTALFGTIQDWRIGARGAGQYFDGFIDDIRAYNRALTVPEIRLLASKRGIGLQPRPKQYTYSQTVTGSKRRRILTGMP